MSLIRQGLASKLLAVLGGAGLAISLCAPRVGAESPVPPWTNANYANRYVCNVTSTTATVPGDAARSFFTGIMRLAPTGSGFFQGGDLEVALTPFTGNTPTGNPTTNFCTYTLTTGSIYTVNEDGTGGESLIWTAPSTPITGCPPSFTMTASLVFRNNETDNNTAPRVDMTIDNFLGLQLAEGVTESGHGYCVK
jgi:hypothetical protein